MAEPSTAGPLVGVLRLIGGAIVDVVRKVGAVNKAGSKPESFKAADAKLSEASHRRLTATFDQGRGLSGATDALLGGRSRADVLETPNAIEWMRLPDVAADLQLASDKLFLGLPVPPDLHARLVDSFTKSAYASSAEAEPVVLAACASLAAAKSAAVGDVGVAALTQTAHRDSIASLATIDRKVSALVARKTAGGTEEVPVLDDAGVVAWRSALLAASEGLLRWPTTLGDGQSIERPELRSLLDIASDADGQVIALLGGPGTGKSALLAQLGAEVSALPNVSLLAIKGDLLAPEVANEEDLQRALGLPYLPSRMVKALARVGRVVILLDQLDALAGHLDVKTGRLSVLLNFARVCGAIENVTLVVSCRTFEFSHDLRLSTLRAESLELQPPSWEEVLAVLEHHGVHAAAWAEDAREVMRVPQQLKTFLTLHSEGGAEPFTSYTRMLEQLWERRVSGGPNGERLVATAFHAAELMADRETLWLAKARFDGQATELNALLAGGVLVEVRGSIGFTHQTVFEHVLARQFAREDGRLSQYILGRKGSLFVRPKVWAGLTYLRTVEPDSYGVELRAVWNDASLPSHLRFLILEFMGAQQEPIDLEEALMRQAWANERLAPIALKAVTGSKGWFDRLRDTLVRMSMLDNRLNDLCIHLLSSAWVHSAAGVNRLLLEVWMPDPANDLRTLSVLQFAPAWPQELQTGALVAAARSRLELSRIDYWLSSIAAVDPSFAIELLAAFLEKARSNANDKVRELKLAAERDRPAEGEPPVEWHIKHRFSRPLEALVNSESDWSTANSLAEFRPREFLFKVTAWLAAVCQDLQAATGDFYPVIGFPLKYSLRLSADESTRQLRSSESLIDALLAAMGALSQSDPASLLQFSSKFAGTFLAPVQRLVAEALVAMPEQSADAAHDFLLADSRRFHLGNMRDTSATTKDLIRNCSPFWTSEQLETFIAAVSAYSPPRPASFDHAEGARKWLRTVRHTRVKLLRALPAHLRAGMADKDVQAPFKSMAGGEGEIGGFIGSPMDMQQFMRASVDDIVNAFRKIPDKAEWVHPEHFMRGGNVQLSREFALLAKDRADRVLEVLSRLESNFGQRGAGYALEALAETAEPEKIQASLLSLLDRGFGNTEFRASVSTAVTRLANRKAPIEERILEAMSSWVLSEHPADESKDAVADAKSGEDTTESFLLSDDADQILAINGNYQILSAVVHTRLTQNEADKAVALLTEYLALSRDSETWQLLVDQLLWLLQAHVRGVVELVSGVLAIEEMDGTPAAAALHVHAARYGAEEAVQANLPRWRLSKVPKAKQGYGEVVGLISMVQPEAGYAVAWLAQIVERDDAIGERVGVAASAAHIVWRHREYQATATTTLAKLLERNEPGVWRRVFRLFSYIESLKDMPEAGRLIETIAAQIEHAPTPKERQFVERLSDLLPTHASAVARISETLTVNLSESVADPTSLLATSGEILVDLALTLHRTEGTQVVGTRMFEQLIELDAYQARQVLDEIDHRIRPSNQRSLPRLPRRHPAQRRRTLRAATERDA